MLSHCVKSSFNNSLRKRKNKTLILGERIYILFFVTNVGIIFFDFSHSFSQNYQLSLLILGTNVYIQRVLLPIYISVSVAHDINYVFSVVS